MLKNNCYLFLWVWRFIFFALCLNYLDVYLSCNWLCNCLRYSCYSIVWMPINICSVERWGFLDGAVEIIIHRCLLAALTIVAKKKFSHSPIATTGKTQKVELHWYEEGVVFSESALPAKQSSLVPILKWIN